MADYLAKQALVSILSLVLGRVLDVDFDKVEVSVWQGEISLSDVSLHPDALEHLLEDYGGGASLPITMVSGSVRNVSVTVPWGTLTSSPVRIVVDGVRLVACACDCDAGGGGAEEKRWRERGEGTGGKKSGGASAASRTSTAEKKKKKKEKKKKKPAAVKNKGTWAGYFEELGATYLGQIGDNLEISVKDVALEFVETGGELGPSRVRAPIACLLSCSALRC